MSRLSNILQGWIEFSYLQQTNGLPDIDSMGAKGKKLKEEMHVIATEPVRLESLALKSEAARVTFVPHSASDALSTTKKTGRHSHEQNKP